MDQKHVLTERNDGGDQPWHNAYVHCTCGWVSNPVGYYNSQMRTLLNRERHAHIAAIAQTEKAHG